jgi:hypothetical protein
MKTYVGTKEYKIGNAKGILYIDNRIVDETIEEYEMILVLFP